MNGPGLALGLLPMLRLDIIGQHVDDVADQLRPKIQFQPLDSHSPAELRSLLVLDTREGDLSNDLYLSIG